MVNVKKTNIIILPVTRIVVRGEAVGIFDGGLSEQSSQSLDQPVCKFREPSLAVDILLEIRDDWGDQVHWGGSKTSPTGDPVGGNVTN